MTNIVMNLTGRQIANFEKAIEKLPHDAVVFQKISNGDLWIMHPDIHVTIKADGTVATLYKKR